MTRESPHSMCHVPSMGQCPVSECRCVGTLYRICLWPPPRLPALCACTRAIERSHFSASVMAHIRHIIVDVVYDVIACRAHSARTGKGSSLWPPPLWPPLLCPAVLTGSERKQSTSGLRARNTACTCAPGTKRALRHAASSHELRRPR